MSEESVHSCPPSSKFVIGKTLCYWIQYSNMLFLPIENASGWRLALKKLRNYKRKYFCVGHKNRRKNNQHFKIAVFHNKSTLSPTSNQISTYIKLNLPLTSNIYFVFLPLEMQKTRTGQSIPRVFLLCLKRNNPQTFKSGRWKNSFLQPVFYCYNLLRWMFFVLCDNWKALLLMKVYRYSEIFLSAMLLLSLKPVFWKMSVFYRLSSQ